MKVEIKFGRKFHRDLRRVYNQKLRQNVQSQIEGLERASSLWDIIGVKKIQSTDDLYRIRIDSHHLTFAIEDNKVELIRFRHSGTFIVNFRSLPTSPTPNQNRHSLPWVSLHHLKPVSEALLREIQVILALKSHPKLRRVAETQERPHTWTLSERTPNFGVLSLCTYH